jgi:hypothetical protein
MRKVRVWAEAVNATAKPAIKIRRRNFTIIKRDTISQFIALIVTYLQFLID